ncbi:MAG TPA: zinc ribbon domain-containing protein [Gemmatimonadales bacterium]|nr:zinc ribbon domain-containing protein [Gemmatimonadales bacterium]
MNAQEPLGPFCQSCSMPLYQPEDFGTDPTGHRVNDYCRHCYADGQFTQPAMSLAEMVDHGTAVMVHEGLMPEASARALLTEFLPRLKRWQPVPYAASETGGRGLTGGDEMC